MNPTRTLLLPLALAFSVGELAAQTTRAVPQPQEFVTTQDDSLFSLTRSQEDVHEWEQAREDLASGAVDSAVERLHRVLQHEIGGTVAIGPNHFIGLRHALVLELANLPPAAQLAYEALVRRDAGALQDQDPGLLRTDQLRMLAERFPAAAVGRRARMRLGDLALESGRGHEAASHFALLLQASPIGSDLEKSARSRQRCADALVRSAALRMQQDPSPELRDMLLVTPRSLDQTDWKAAGGGGDGNLPMVNPAGRPQPHFADALQATGFDYGGGGTFAMQPTGGLDGLFLHTGLEVLAVDPLRGEILWSSAAPLRELNDARAIREYPQSINPNMVLAPALADDVVVAALQVPDESTAVRYQNAFMIMQRMPERRLFAFQRSTGKILWSHYDGLGGAVTARFRGHAASGPPLIVGETVYAPVHDRSGAIAFYVGAYDLRTGQPRWRRLVCSSQQEVNMFGNARQEFAASPLCASQGLILGASNLGVCFAIERDSGRLSWVTSYDVVRMPAAQLQGQEARTVFFQNSPPAITDGVLCCTPLDSEHVLGLDVETGQLLWRIPHQAKVNGNNDVRWLCGVLDGEFVLSGAGIVAVRARPDVPFQRTPPLRQIRSRDTLFDDGQDEFPRPAVTNDRIYAPSADGIRILDRAGEDVSDASPLMFKAPGNLLLVDGMAVSLRNGVFEVHLDLSALRALAEKRQQDSPNDPTAILRVCTLLGATGATDEAQLDGLYRRGIAAATAQGLPREHPLHATFLRRLFEAAVQRGERKSGQQAIDLLVDARDLAPDRSAFLQVESLLLDRLRDDRPAFLRELTVLEQRASGDSFALPEAGGVVEVDVYVRWRRTLLEAEPAKQVLGWQQLLQLHPTAILQRRRVSELAQSQIAQLIQKHGVAVYAPIESEARDRLVAAGSTPALLRAICAEFPHSNAAREAEQRLLDDAVRSGDLSTAIDVYAAAARSGDVSPSILRRVLTAAATRGNRTLAARFAARLVNAAGTSDWQEDAGKPFADVGKSLLAEFEVPLKSAAPELPADVVAELENPAPPAPVRLLPITHAPGFLAAADTPLFLGLEEQVRAIDLADPSRPTLFVHKSGGIDRLWLCGRTLLVPNLERIDAIEARTGVLQWQLAIPDTLLICHGVVAGVLLVSQRGSDDQVLLVGIEPLTGRQLFARNMPTDEYAPQPRSSAVDLLTLRVFEGAAPTIERIDPLTGRTTAAIELGQAVLDAAQTSPEVLKSPLMLQRFCADDTHVYLPLDGSLCKTGEPAVIALTNDGSVAWQWHGEPGQSIAMDGVLGNRYAIVASGAPPRAGKPQIDAAALVLDAGTGKVLRVAALGAEMQVLNWRRLRSDSPAPERLLVSDVDRDSGDRRLVCVPVRDGLEPFAISAGSANEDVVRTPWCSNDLLVYATHSRRATGPVRLYAQNLRDRSNALPGGRNSLILAVPPRSAHELGTSLAYTVLVTDTRIFVFGGGENSR